MGKQGGDAKSQAKRWFSRVPSFWESLLFLYGVVPTVLSTIPIYAAYKIGRDLAGHPGGLALILMTTLSIGASVIAVTFALFQRHQRKKIRSALELKKDECAIWKSLVPNLSAIDESLRGSLNSLSGSNSQAKRSAETKDTLKTLLEKCSVATCSLSSPGTVAVSILHLNEHSERFHIVSQTGLKGIRTTDEELTDLTLDASAAGLCIAENHTIVVSDTHQYEHTERAKWARGKHRAIICSPITVSNNRRYVLAVTSQEPNVFGEFDREQIEHFAAKAALVITSLS